MSRILKLAFLSLSLAATCASADSSGFGASPVQMCFGSGSCSISNAAVAYSQLTTDTGTLTLGLTAHQRYVGNVGYGPGVTNNGAGVFHTGPGGSPPYLPDDNQNNSGWNVAFAVVGSDAQSFSAYTYRLLVDFDPTIGNGTGTYVDMTSAWLNADDSDNIANSLQNSENLGFADPAGDMFNPNGPGEYGFVLQAFQRSTDGDGFQLVAETSIVMDVPEPASLALVGIALLGAVGASRRRKQQ